LTLFPSSIKARTVACDAFSVIDLERVVIDHARTVSHQALAVANQVSGVISQCHAATGPAKRKAGFRLSPE
jgi:hypothetical protein